MQRKACFPVANCTIRMPDNVSMHAPETTMCEDESEQQQRRQQLINFGHAQWGFNNWSWTVTKQELDFVDFTNGKYSAGVVAFVSITVKTFDIHRENIGYATSIANNKGFAIYKSRKCAVTNALKETLLSFGGNVAAELMETLDTHRIEISNVNTAPPPEPMSENNQNLPNKPTEPKNATQHKNIRKDSSDSGSSNPANNGRSPHLVPAIKNAPNPPPPVAKAHPMPANLPPAANRPALAGPRAPAPAPAAGPPPHARPNSNELPEGLSEEEARAERKRRQRLAQEEFRLKQLSKQKAGLDGKQDLSKNSTIDKLLMDIPTQDIVIEESGDMAGTLENGKRKSPVPEVNTAKRRASVLNKLDVVQSE